jgi:hypothetical protein
MWVVFVETLDKVFENVCELDLIFHSDKVRAMTLFVLKVSTFIYLCNRCITFSMRSSWGVWCLKRISTKF